MRIQHDSLEFKHIHAYTEYSLVSWKHYAKLLWSVLDYKLRGGYSLTVHLPYEVQHPEFLSDLKRGLDFIEYGELLKRLFRVRLYWENSPWLKPPKWNLRYTNTNWRLVPRDIQLCLDTGHLMLGARNKATFYTKLAMVVKARGKQIKHLHLSENDFKRDHHSHAKKILTDRRVKSLTRNRTFIWEQ